MSCARCSPADAGVAAGRGDIDEAVLDHDLHAHVGVAHQKLVEQRRQDVDHHRAGHVQFQQAAYFLVGAGDVMQRRACVGQQRREAIGQRAAGLGRHHAARGARQQRHAQLCFDAGDGFADG
jgi:hypothetical protein